MSLLTTDQKAVAVILSTASNQQKQDALESLLGQSAIANGLQCEDCGSARIESNGQRGVELTFLCLDCGHQWSPNI